MNDVEGRNDRDLIFTSMTVAASLIFGTLCCAGSFFWAVFA